MIALVLGYGMATIIVEQPVSLSVPPILSYLYSELMEDDI